MLGLIILAEWFYIKTCIKYARLNVIIAKITKWIAASGKVAASATHTRAKTIKNMEKPLAGTLGIISIINLT